MQQLSGKLSEPLTPKQQALEAHKWLKRAGYSSSLQVGGQLLSAPYSVSTRHFCTDWRCSEARLIFALSLSVLW